uniref:Disease resistance protein winged helix domain-containing protein n=1 Tax=Quercus lobata TaxID=97700 RepID=A0A7N2LRZ4_QUELO
MNNDMIEDDDIDLGSFGIKMILLDLKLEIILMKLKMKMKMKRMMMMAVVEHLDHMMTLISNIFITNGVLLVPQKKPQLAHVASCGWWRGCGGTIIKSSQEDFNIPTKKLVRLWVAKGFVPLKYELEGDEMLEDYAEHYLVDLINRCMVQVGVIGSNGRIKSCHLHDLMRDLCLSKAKQENSLHILSPWSGNETVDSSIGSI